MNNNNITFKILKPNYKSFDCDCCGICFPEGIFIYYNEELIWEQYSDGHYSGNRTEDSIVNSILNKWLKDNNAELLLNSSEEGRNNYNIQYPGNVVARTPESWKEHNSSIQEHINIMYDIFQELCAHLPSNEALQVKMIALWLEEQLGQKINIIEVSQ